MNRGLPFFLPPSNFRGKFRHGHRALFRSVLGARIHTREYTRSLVSVTIFFEGTPRGT
jgi:hypothetical protein